MESRKYLSRVIAELQQIAIEEIDKQFFSGYAAANPAMLTGYVQALATIEAARLSQQGAASRAASRAAALRDERH